MDREAVEVPVMFENNVEVSTKYYLEKTHTFPSQKINKNLSSKFYRVLSTTASFDALAPETRGCHLTGTDEFEMGLLKWAPYTRSNCVLVTDKVSLQYFFLNSKFETLFVISVW